jgi:ubiquinone/menaquinone biosynthesis C-methylase UbiE
MSFDVAADAYDRFMGRYSVHLASQLADLAAIEAGQEVLDVGCGPGAFTVELVRRLGAGSVSAVDPSAAFVEAIGARYPGVHVQQAFAENLPFRAETFDAAVAQLVVHFMADPVAGLREMRRVTRDGGVVAACVWDHAGGQGPLSPYWKAALTLYPSIEDESARPGSREGHLAELFREADLEPVEDTALSVSVEHPTFEEWWEPFTLGVGPAGSFMKTRSPEEMVALREACRAILPPAPFTITARAWTVVARV